jgi:putative peptidoglycan lipid II flippase
MKDERRRSAFVFRLSSLACSLISFLRGLPSYEFSISAGSLAYMLAYLFSASLGIVRQVLLNAQFGVGMEATAYYAAFRLPDTLNLLVAGGTLTNALLPVLIAVRQGKGPVAASRLLGAVLGTLLVLLAPIILLGLLFAPLFVRSFLAPGFDSATSELTIQLTRLMLFEVLLVLTESVLVAQLMSRNRLFLPVLALALRNISLIGGIVLAMVVPGVGIYGPTIGAVGDALLQLLIILPGLRREPAIRPRWAWGDRDLRTVLRLLLPNGLSAVVNYGGVIVETSYASRAAEPGALPALFNAQLLVGLPLRLIGVAIGQAALPYFAAHVASGDRGALRRDLRRAVLIGLGLAVVASLALLLLGRLVVRLLFERGRFDAAAGDLTYSLLAAFAICLPVLVLTELFSRALISLYDTRTPLFTNILQLMLRIALLIPLIGSLGVLAIPVSAGISAAAETLILGGVVWWKLRGISYSH